MLNRPQKKVEIGKDELKIIIKVLNFFEYFSSKILQSSQDAAIAKNKTNA